MELLNEMVKVKAAAWGSPAWDEAVEIYLQMTAPVAPHLTEELWSLLEKPYSIHISAWPKVDEAAARDDVMTLIVQVNGKLRDRITLPADVTEHDAKAAALGSETVLKFLDGKPPRQVIYVAGRLINIVV